MCASPTASVPDLLTFRVQAAAAAVLKPVGITVPKESVPATPVNQLHHITNRTNKTTRHGLTPSRQPIPDSAIRCRQRRQQYSARARAAHEPHVHIACVCAPGTPVPRGHT